MSAPLKIRHFVESYPPDYGGGAALFIQEVCRETAARGHEVRVLCVESRDAEPYTLRTEFDGPVRLDRLNLPYFIEEDPDGWALGLAAWIRHQRRIEALVGDLLDEWPPDLVQYNVSRPLGEEAVMAAHRRGVPVLGMPQEAWLICPRIVLLRSPNSDLCEGPAPGRCLECVYSHYDGSHARAVARLPIRAARLGVYPAYRLLRRRAARRALSGAMSYSRFQVARHAPHLPGPIRYVPLGMSLAGLPPERPARPRTPLRFGFMGGFQPIKGVWDVLDAAASLKRAGLAFELRIWGPGQEGAGAEVAARGLEGSVSLRGMFAHEERWDVYNEIDVALMATTIAETLGRIPLEAAAVGAPTIAPAIGGIPELIRDDVDGLLFRVRDREDLERQMRRFLEDPGLLPRLAANLRPPRDTREFISEVEAFYYDSLGRPAAPATRAGADEGAAPLGG